MKKIFLISLAIIIFCGANAQGIKISDNLKTNTILFSTSRYDVVITDTLGNWASRDSAGQWTIKGDTLKLLNVMVDLVFKRQEDVFDKIFIEPPPKGKLINVLHSKNN